MRCCLEPCEPSVSDQIVACLCRGLRAAAHLVSTALTSPHYSSSLAYSLEYVFYNSFGLAHRFVCGAWDAMRWTNGHAVCHDEFAAVLPSLRQYHELVGMACASNRATRVQALLAEMTSELDRVEGEFEGGAPPLPRTASLVSRRTGATGSGLPDENPGIEESGILPHGHSLSSATDPATASSALPLEWTSGSFDFFTNGNTDLAIDEGWIASVLEGTSALESTQADGSYAPDAFNSGAW